MPGKYGAYEVTNVTKFPSPPQELKPDREQLSLFADALLRYVSDDGYLSLRAFMHGNQSKPFVKHLWPVRLNGTGLSYAIDVAEDIALRAAQNPEPVVFCPPLAVFSNKEHSGEKDLIAGPVLSAELDRSPRKAQELLEQLIGMPTIVVRSGGTWEAADGSLEDKLHLHWRLAKPACGDDLAKLKEARRLAARLVGGDVTNVPLVHPIRWPGSWHRKGSPRLCDIELLAPGEEIDLDAALAALRAAAPEEPLRDRRYQLDLLEGGDWGDLIGNIMAGRQRHDSTIRLAAKLVSGGLSGGASVNFTRAVMRASPEQDAEWSRAYEDIPRAVRGAEEKFKVGALSKSTVGFEITPFNEIKMQTENRHLVKNLLPASGLVVVWGPPKCGKSFKIMDLMLHVALEWPYRGRRVKQGPVVYCAMEGVSGYGARKEAFCRQHTLDGGAHVDFYLMGSPMALVSDHKSLIASIKEKLAETSPIAVVIDTLNRSMTGSESDDSDMRAYIASADAIRDAFDCAVIIVHHCGIDGTRPRGHTSLTGAVDAQLAVKRDPYGTVTLTVEWMKDGPEGDVIASRLEQIEVGTDEDGDPITSCIVEPVDDPGQPTERLPAAARLALDCLREVIDECGKIAPYSPHIPQNTRTSTISEWRQRCYQKTIADSDNPDSKQKAFVRASKRLQILRIIGVWGEYVWVFGQAGQCPDIRILSGDT